MAQNRAKMVREETMKLILSKSASEEMKKECLSHPLVETGGILLGRFEGDEILAPFVTGAGPKAVRTASSFEPDVEWQQVILNELFEKYKVNYVGSYHKHPDYITCPSFIDYGTAIHILLSPEWNVSQIVFPIIVSNSKGIEVYPYYISRDSKDFRPIAMGIIPDEEFCELKGGKRE